METSENYCPYREQCLELAKQQARGEVIETWASIGDIMEEIAELEHRIKELEIMHHMTRIPTSCG